MGRGRGESAVDAARGRAGRGDEWREVEAVSGAGRVTHEAQVRQTREVSKGPIRQTGQLVEILLGSWEGVDETRERRGGRRCGKAGRGYEWREVKAVSGAGRITHEVQLLQAREVSKYPIR